MDKQTPIIAKIVEQGLLPLFYHQEIAVCIDLLRSLYTAGVRSVEFTNRGEAALANFKAMKQVCEIEMPEMYLGVGTIKNASMAQGFIDAGANFIISPGLVNEVAMLAKEKSLPWIPGCMTPTEIIAAETMGAKLVKLFPGNLLGPAFMSAIKDLFPGMLFMPTGGVDTSNENIESWFNAGVSAVGMGSKLISQYIMENRKYDLLISETKKLLQLIQRTRS
ncbi:MAG TPA: bifunctional 4-hydroxy-2-oxoglutarate aldolase/2-dehydro-3-deoxy-phosphogluconate aldolase [Ferruginibacter sp.]|jgi:2-dehydro-3-deoxyphosphogluconate aldolase/(4S)-4-hydroxy-2-oxoglutarate aldolase|nr:bifunctional 4-hydroxy-2-oxoglutarate aldolase/2-dehydro-3-deoxy-phosphogluconate aldolase [Ferruginibacter sp.]